MWLVVMLACQSNTESTTNSAETSTVEPVVSTKSEETAPDSTPEPKTTTVSTVAQTVYLAVSGDCQTDCVKPVKRTVAEWTPQVAMDVLYQGPTADETQLVLMACESTGAKVNSVDNGVATVQLVGGCGGCGTRTIADLIEPTLLGFAEIQAVQLLDPQGRTQLEGKLDSSRPSCLEP